MENSPEKTLNDAMCMNKVTVNGRIVLLEDGATLLDAAAQAGVYVPTLCHFPTLPSRAVCRMCLVDIEGHAQPRAACTTVATDGDVIVTDSPSLQTSRRATAQWLLARHPNDCMRCEVNRSCRLQSLVNENQWATEWPITPRASEDHPEHILIDHTSPSIQRDISKCIECGLCADVCGEAGQQQYIIGFAERGEARLPVTVFDQPLAETDCISCGQCTWVCPVGALIEAPHWREVLHILDSHRRVTTVQVAPATRIAISEEFGMRPGTVSTGRLINALRLLGFDYVFDTNFAADLTVMEEAAEFLRRLSAGDRLPLFTSCCPGWVNWVEIHRPDLIPHLSTTKSPQQMHAALAKRGPFVRTLGAEFAAGRAEPYVVSVMPCTAKKDEAVRPGMNGDLDHALTTRELARMIKARAIPFATLPEDGRFDSPLGESTGAGQIFAASGGVLEALLRTAMHLRGTTSSTSLEWQQLRGVREGLKTAEVPGVGTVAVCNGIATAQRLLESEDWRKEFVAVEVMACVGGCLGGGGEPKSMDASILEKRRRAVYDIDQRAAHRASYENEEVRSLYAEELGQPSSTTTRALLHTSYAARNSKRLLLMRFLDCVDRRDGKGAARLFHPEGVWETGSSLGTVQGAANIQALIENTLPARRFGAGFARHRMVSYDNLTVFTPTDERCDFELDVESMEAGNTHRQVIRTLVRRVLSD